MNRVVVRAALLLGAVGLGSAGAQNLRAYDQLARSLDGAVTARSQSSLAALTQLDAAKGALDQLVPTLRNRQIVSGLRDALSGARAALSRTPAELEAQVLLARGLMRKALYDQTLTQLSGTPGNSAAQLRVLTREFGLSGAAAQAVVADAGKGRLERVAWQLQRTAVQKVSASLALTKAEQTTASYVNLARATSWFTVVQDTGGAQGLRVAQFGDALRQLTAGDTAALGASLTGLRSGVAALSSGLASPPAVTPAVTPPKVGAGSAGGSVPVKVPAPAPQGSSGAVPITSASGTGASAGAAGGAAQPIRPAGGAAGVYAALGRALAAAGHADNALARAQLVQASAALGSVPDALSTTNGFERLSAHLRAAQDRGALRPSDVQALIAELANVEMLSAGQPGSVLDATSAGVARGFSGWLRVLVFFLLAALCGVPLYLLNMAFGGRNTYWRAIMAGMALLLLPVFLEGLFGLLGAVGDLSGVGALRSLSNFTLTQGAYGLPVWALLAAGAIGLSSFGFRGLCQQFGLLGAQPTPKNTTQQNLDWDEDV